MKFRCIAILFFSLLTGCASSFHGIKVRAESPSITEAFKKLSLAVTIDDYELASINHQAYSLETNWRALKDNERAKNEDGKVRLRIQLDTRGRLYDVRITPIVKNNEGGIQPTADIRHPLFTKWKRILHSIVEKESRDED